MREKQSIPTAVVPVKEMGLHAKVQSLQTMFMTLAASLQPTIIPGEEGPIEFQSKMCSGVKTSIETALIHTCNRICALMGDEQNWANNDADAREILSMLVAQSVKDSKQKRKPRVKKGPNTDEQK
jgi:hypothetical protein